MRVAVAGCANTGKTTLYNGLCAKNEKTGNYHGVTVRAATAELSGNKNVTVTDLAGLYSFDAYSLEERASRLALEGGFDLIINVVDANNLQRDLILTRQLLLRGFKLVLIVNFINELKKRGGYLNIDALSGRLGVDVIAVDARNKKDVRLVKNYVLTVQCKNSALEKRALEPFAVKSVLKEIYRPAQYTQSKADGLLYNAYLALPTFFAIVAVIFYLAFGRYGVGRLAKEGIELAFNAAAKYASSIINSDVLKSFVCNALLGGGASLLAFVPQIAVLYFSLILMEESGYLSALAFMSDGIFEKVKLSGRAVFILLVGFGCTAIAILSTRSLENKAAQARAAFALSYVPCSAKLPVFLTLSSCFFTNQFLAVTALYLLGVTLAFVFSFLLGLSRKSAFIFELAPFRIPRLTLALASCAHYVKQYVTKVFTVVFAFSLAMWLLSSFDIRLNYCQTPDNSILAQLGRLIKYLFYPMGIRDWKIAASAIGGIVGKESVVGALNMYYPDGLNLTRASAVAFSVLMLTGSPCINAVACVNRELGAKFTFITFLTQNLLSFVFSYAAYALFAVKKLDFIVLCVLLLIMLAAYLLIREKPKKRKSHRAKIIIKNSVNDKN